MINRHKLDARLDAEIAAGDHDAVGCLNYLVKIGDRLGHLDLGNEQGTAELAFVEASDNVLDLFAVGGLADKRKGNVVDILPHRPNEVGVVFLRHRRYRQRRVGQIDALAFRQNAADDHTANDIGLRFGFHDQLDRTVIDQYPRARLDRIRQMVEICRHFAYVSVDCTGRDRKLLAF